MLKLRLCLEYVLRSVRVCDLKTEGSLRARVRNICVPIKPLVYGRLTLGLSHEITSITRKATRLHRYAVFES
jgi:hypothetical protein